MERDRRIQAALIICAALCPLLQAQYGGGAGTPDDPYLIDTPEQLNAIGTDPNDWDKHFRLMADVDLSDSPFNIIGTSASHPFKGTFNGGGYTISGLVCSSDKAYTGLFGYIDDPDAEISNVTLDSPDVASTADCVGAMVGFLGEGTLINCHVLDGKVAGKEYVGGLAGRSGGTVSMCGATCTVTGERTVGGLAGYSGGVAVSCFSAGSVSGGWNTGGLVGSNGGVISDSYSLAHVHADGMVGGLAGLSSGGEIYNCFAAGRISSRGGVHSAGGLIGGCAAGGRGAICGTASNCFWDTEATKQPRSVHGTPKTTREMSDPNMFKSAGWPFLSDPNTGPNYQWTVSPAGGYPVLWWQASPLPAPPAFSGGSGTSADPYLLATSANLNSIGSCCTLMKAHFKLIHDIDLAGQKSFTIGSSLLPFRGVFDGNNYAIANFACNDSSGDYMGLFARVDGSHAEVRNLRLLDPNVGNPEATYVGSLVGWLTTGRLLNCSVENGHVAGKWRVGGLAGLAVGGDIVQCLSHSHIEGENEVGGLIGYGTGRILRCRSSGSVSGQSYVGGLAGWAGGAEAEIAESISSAFVSGNTNVGGLVGTVGGSVRDCYSDGQVSGDRKVGGLAGENRGMVVSSYSAASVSGSTDVGGLIGAESHVWKTYTSFWNVQIGGQTVSAGGTGKSTAEMQRATTFTGWGWKSAWTIDEGRDHPRLAWENKAGIPITTPALGSLAGAGTEGDPYLIHTPEEFNIVGQFPSEWDKQFKLMADIDLAGYPGRSLNAIGAWYAYPFTGVFDGNGHRILNFRNDGEQTSSIGLFRCVDHGAMIKNLGLIDPLIKAPQGYSGILAARLGNGRIENCYVLGGGISGGDMLGGLVAVTYGDIYNCHTTTDVAGVQTLGGLAGSTFGGRIVDCYSTGSVSSVNPYSTAGGLVGEHRTGEILRCSATGAVSGTGTSVGGLAGVNWADITASHATGTVSGDWIVGGLVAGNNGNVRQCYSSADVSGTREIGGLVGRNDGPVSDSYSLSTVTANDEAGGLVGVNLAALMNSFAAGTIQCPGSKAGGLVGSNGWLGLRNEGTVLDCVWDRQASGRDTMCGLQTSEATGCDNAAGKTTGQMRQLATFLAAGWDFVNETENGTEDIWTIDEGKDYPRLAWESHLAEIP